MKFKEGQNMFALAILCGTLIGVGFGVILGLILKNTLNNGMIIGIAFGGVNGLVMGILLGREYLHYGDRLDDNIYKKRYEAEKRKKENENKENK